MLDICGVGVVNGYNLLFYLKKLCVILQRFGVFFLQKVRSLLQNIHDCFTIMHEFLNKHHNISYYIYADDTYLYLI